MVFFIGFVFGGFFGMLACALCIAASDADKENK